MSIPLGDLVEQEIGNRYNQGAGNQTIAQQLQLVSCNGKGKSAWPIDPMSPVNCLYATTTNDCQMQLQRTLQLQLQHKRVSIEAESVDGKCLAFVCLARELYTYIYICISMHILYISTDRLILGVQCGSCLHYNCRSSLDQKRWLPFASALAFVLVFQFQLFSFSVFHRLGERPSLDDRLTELAMPTAKTK